MGRSDLGGWAADARDAIAVAARQPSLARAELAFGATVTTDLALGVGLTVVAFRDGGAALVGLIAVLRLLPAGVIAPLAATLGDRHPRDRVLALSSLATAVPAGLMAALLAADGPMVAVYGSAVAATIAMTPYRAAHSALLPVLCRSSDELTASNIVRALVEAFAVIGGPLITAALLATDAWTVFAFTALTSTAAMLLVLDLPYERVEAVPAEPPPGRLTPFRQFADAVTSTLRHREARLLISLAGTQTFLRGALGVFLAVLAIDTLGKGDGGVGVLQAAAGLGGLLGALGSSRLVGTTRMARWFGGAVAWWGIPLCAVGAYVSWPFALAMLGVIGLANAVLDVGLFTMLGRLVPNEVLARVFGVFEAVVAATVAAGAAVAAGLVDAFGIRWALVAIGAVAPVAVALRWRVLTRLDESLTVRQRELDVLQQVPMLRALTVAAIERLGRRLHIRLAAPGEVIVAEGSPASSYYVIASGEVEVREGEAVVRRLGPGAGFGEVALLRDVSRTATVTATDDGPVELLRIDRADFVDAVSTYPSASRLADESIAEVGR